LSPLTKLFVGLLVVLSLITTAAFVTFVTSIDNQKKLAAQIQQTLRTEKDRAEASLAQAQAESARAQDAERFAQSQVEELQRATNQFKSDIAKANVELAEKSSQIAIQSANESRLSEALKASEDTKSRLQEQVAALRTSNDQMLQQAAQASQQISDLTNKYEVVERERRYATEQLEQLRQDTAKLSAALQETGKNPREILASVTLPAAGVGAPKINGVVREVRTIAGLPYATISVGSADSVTKGMTFNIIERNGNFLGKVTIDTVELNEATGRITGPKTDQVKPGVEVKTQL
jgi:DNA polymerase III alpha subunit (gram-positive type)